MDLGSVYKIKIRHDNSFISPSWYLEYVEIKDTTDNQTFMFHCERWLAKNKDDRKIERSVYVKVSGYSVSFSVSQLCYSTPLLAK